MNLYPIQQQHLTLLSIVEDNEGEVTTEIENALQLTQEQFKEQALSVANVYRTLDDREALIKKEIERLKALQERTTKARDMVKDKLREAMLLFDVREIKGDTLKLSFRKSTSVEVDMGKIPESYISMKEVLSVDKGFIKTLLEAGREIPGATLVKKDNLQIK